MDSDENIGVLASVLHADGGLADSLMTELPASNRNPRITKEMLDEGGHYPIMNGSAVFKLALRKLPEAANETLAKAGLTMDDVDLVIPHQANLRINQAFQKTFNLAEDRVFHNIQRYGNTTAASIPIALDEAIEQGRIDTANSTVLFVALGAGLTWGGALYRFGK